MPESLIVIDNLLKDEKDLNNYCDFKKINLLLELLDYKVKNYDNTKDYNYLSKIFPEISNSLLNIKENGINDIIVKVNSVHYSLKVQIELMKEKESIVDQFLKDTIDNIEALTLALNYDYLTEYHGNKYSLMEFLVFKLKNPVMIADAIKRFPYVVNLVDSDGNSLFSKIVQNYIEEIITFSLTKNSSNDELVYYDNILNLFFTSKELYVDYIFERDTVRNIDNLLDSLDFSKDNINYEKFIFWLDTLKETLQKKEMANNFNFEDLLYKYDIPSDFSLVIKKETNRIVDNFQNVINKSQHSLKNEYIITMDGFGAEEIDDGLSVRKLANGNYLLGVYIANPTKIVPENNIIFQEMEKRTSSIYLSDRTIAMYPPIISKDLLSLKEKRNNLTMAYYLEIDSQTGEIVNFEVKEQVSLVNCNLSYNEVNNYFKTGCCDYLLSETLDNMQIVTELLDKKLHIEDFYKKLYRTTKSNSKKPGTSFTKSQKIVELAMLITNYQIATLMDLKKYPFIYRNHLVNEEQALEIENLKNLFQNDEDFSEFEKHFKVLTSTYPKAYLDTFNKGHFGLGLSHYSHVTSPLRREEDNLNSIAIREFLFDNPTDKRAYEIEELLKSGACYINKRRKPIEEFEENYELGKMLEKKSS